MVKCEYEGIGVWDGRCIGTKEVDPCPGYDKCKQYKPNYTTNADRIRAMSDEELCEFLGEYKFCDICEEGCDNCTYNGDCDNRLLEWLQQPTEEND